MKTPTIKAFIILTGLMLANSIEMAANVTNRTSKGVTDYQGLLISSSIIGGSLLIYFIAKFFIKEDDEKVVKRPHKYVSHRHHRHIIKKTA